MPRIDRNAADIDLLNHRRFPQWLLSSCFSFALQLFMRHRFQNPFMRAGTRRGIS
jgi:hypothetical protein